ncbi:type IV CRISPR-associated DEAD/DEAH-box helicase Csf4 [Burkholderia sp. MBR-1]|uniref:type IV CRISPR-associated DEAD/DEAH-box helicase Csf4 n=1 Tax=Burkholderia sp. MBR-1 TaxID=2732364 RepID=UPI0015EF3F66|nr:type IV CRISPR-associated DEAD/DEAH-box helicase Csf4 [Burkholderia sp. MBR-1]QMI49809.1 DEAD/DEAH box helicase [Burkholderia sp. MBR-1]
MSLNMTLAVPDGWLSSAIPQFEAIRHDDERVRSAVKLLVAQSLRDGLSIPNEAIAETGDRRRIFISLPEPEAGMLRARASACALGHAPLARALIAAASLRDVTPESWDEEDPIVRLTRLLQAVDPQVTVRSEQIKVAAMMRDCLDRDSFGLVEAGTGVGKTRAMVCSAIEWIVARGKRVVIAAPTIALIRQFAAEFALQRRVSDMPRLRVVFGRREFVSQHALEAFLSDPAGRQRDIADLDAVHRWAAKGGTDEHADDGVEARWLVGSLERIAPGFPIDEVRLSDLNSVDDHGYRAYRAQFEVADTDEEELVLCTHAMLAQDMRTRLRAAGQDESFRDIDNEIVGAIRLLRQDSNTVADAREALRALNVQRSALFNALTEDRGLLPDYRALIVDEGHLLEQIFSNSLSRYVSLKACVRHVREFKHRGGRIAAQTIERLDGLVDEISSVGGTLRRDFVTLSGNDGPVRRLAVLLQRVAECLDEIPAPRRLSGVDPARLRAVIQARAAAAVIRGAAGAAISRSYLRFSPMRVFPQLYVGSGSVESILRTMWSRLDAGAIVSASLYLKRVNDVSASYQRMLLALPEQRWIEYPPVHAPWSVAPVVGLWTPGELASKLRPPTRADRLTDTEYQRAEEAWLDNLAPVIQSSHETARGGTLVLLTSYRAAEGISKRLAGASTFLVEAHENRPLQRQVADFLELRRAGVRPLWLAVGGAWTGVDVGGHDPWARLFEGECIPAADDNVLTDLIIPRLPFGTNQSITHLWRSQNRAGVPWDLLEAAFRFKQGLGRLVRRGGLPANRRIFVLDGRLEDADAGSAYALFKQLMQIYPVKAFPLE